MCAGRRPPRPLRLEQDVCPLGEGRTAEKGEQYPVVRCRAKAWLDVRLELDGVEPRPRNCPSVRFRTSGEGAGGGPVQCGEGQQRVGTPEASGKYATKYVPLGIILVLPNP